MGHLRKVDGVDLVMKLGGQLPRGLQRMVGQEPHHLVAAVPHGVPQRRDRLAKDPRQLTNRVVTDLVAVGVVDVLEPIRLKAQYGGNPVCPTGKGPQGILEKGGVVQPGELVGVYLEPELIEPGTVPAEKTVG